MRRTIAVLSLAGLLLGGCGTQRVLLGTEGSYFFVGYDQLTTPGGAAVLQTRLQAGDLLANQPGYTVKYFLGPDLYAAALTDQDGYARAPFTAESPGDYIFKAQPAPTGFSQTPPEPMDIFIASRPADTPLLIVDLDKTIVESGFRQVLFGQPKPMANSARVMQQLAKDYTVVYLTHRPEYFGPKSKQWLADNGYPRAPVLLSSLKGFASGSKQFKSTRLAEIHRQFTNIRIGVGDKISDAQVYQANGAQAYLIVQTQTLKAPQEMLDLAADISTLPATVQVVSNWDQIERGVFDRQKFPPSAMVSLLQDQARKAGASTTAPAQADAATTPDTQIQPADAGGNQP
jgi:hypothetical protein